MSEFIGKKISLKKCWKFFREFFYRLHNVYSMHYFSWFWMFLALGDLCYDVTVCFSFHVWNSSNILAFFESEKLMFDFRFLFESKTLFILLLFLISNGLTDDWMSADLFPLIAPSEFCRCAFKVVSEEVFEYFLILLHHEIYRQYRIVYKFIYCYFEIWLLRNLLSI